MPTATGDSTESEEFLDLEATETLEILYEHHIVAKKEHIKVFPLGLACKKMHCAL
jgi:hypothetical protein